MEFLRFASSIPGSYWGCCACDIIQDFNQSPDQKATIQLVSGDGGGPILSDREDLFAGPTYRDIFLQRIRFGTFDKRDMPNHAFIAILTENQINGAIGSAWMKILKETGFEFVRTVANSVYTGQNLAAYSKEKGSSLNHIFMLVRNIGANGAGNPYLPPKGWTALPNVTPEAWERLTDTRDMAKECHEAQTKIWNDIGPAKLLKRSEIPEGVPVVLAGQRVMWAKQQTQEERDSAKKHSGLFPDKPEQLPGGITLQATETMPHPIKITFEDDVITAKGVVVEDTVVNATSFYKAS